MARFIDLKRSHTEATGQYFIIEKLNLFISLLQTQGLDHGQVMIRRRYSQPYGLS
jgi:hypothetical protein